MICLNSPLLIMAVWWVCTLLVGICLSRHTITFRTYAMANKQFATATLVTTVLATLYASAFRTHLL